VWGKPKVEIHCDDCKKSNLIDIPEKIQCAHCEKEIELKGSFIKGFGKKAILAIITTGVAFSQVDDVLYPNHYPSEVQYAILEACIAGDSSSYLSTAEIKRKRTICTCAFDNVRDEIGYEIFQNNPDYFIQTLHKEIGKCD